MPYKSLLALHPIEQAIESLAPVAAFARAFDAHVEARVLNLLRPIPTMAFSQKTGYAWSETYTDLFRQTAACEKAVRDYLADAGIDAGVAGEAQQLGLVHETVAHEALYSDLVVIVRGEPLVSGLMGHALEGALLGAGRAVLVLPASGAAPPIEPEAVTIAWDGGREAARAVCEALPLIRRATTVRTLIVEGGGYRALEHGARALTAYLGRHGVKAVTERVAPAGRSVSEALLGRLDEERPELLVMGAYGHRRIREMLFSGVTRSVLSDLQSTPLLLAH